MSIVSKAADNLPTFEDQIASARQEHQKNVDGFLCELWHDAKAEEPKFERWILMADDHGHYMAGLWQNDGKGFEGIGEIHVGPLKFNLPLGMDGDIVRWCYISDIDKNEKGGYSD